MSTTYLRNRCRWNHETCTIVHVLPRQRSNSFQNLYFLSFLSILLKTIQSISAANQSCGAETSPPFFVFSDSADFVRFRFMDNLVLPSGRSICNILFSLLIHIAVFCLGFFCRARCPAPFRDALPFWKSRNDALPFWLKKKKKKIFKCQSHMALKCLRHDI